MNDEERYEAGLKVRREVLGEDYVDQALASADEFSRELQDHLNRFAWGVAWTRPGLDRRTRSLLTLGLLTALGKTAELKTHTRGALRNGCTPEEIAEVFLHASVYAGVPAAVEAFRAAQPVVAEQATGS
jgi:4-carboxymuconolactone decarboxylase